MNSLATFLKDIFSFSDDEIKVGLSQFDMKKDTKKVECKKPTRAREEIKLSDLMRRSY